MNLNDWLRAHRTEYIKSGQIKLLLLALGIGRCKFDDLFPPGCPQEFRLPKYKHRLFYRERVLEFLGVSVQPRR